MQASLARAKLGDAPESFVSRTGARSIFFSLPGMRRPFLIVLVLAFSLLPAVANADRKPTTKEKAQIASVVHLPVVCAHVRVSTVTKKPKWGSVEYRRGGSQCEPLASNGVTVAKKSNGRWRFVTAGSSFSCSELYQEVPEEIAKDLRIDCFTVQ